ncbi:hypothetical protein BSLG_001343 [Batrachochytrium salamandrivorans]|nr:hypothetical protein BSLG_001343 [Batrachochytrium salamandrivorans]
MALYQSLNLYTSLEAYTFEPVLADSSIPRESLVIRRTDGAVLLNAPPSPTLAQEQVTTIHGIMGIIRLNAGNASLEIKTNRIYSFVIGLLQPFSNLLSTTISGDHIIVITGCKRSGTLGGHDIFALTRHDILPVHKSQSLLTERQIQDDLTYLSMLADLLDSGFFYFSYTCDLTHTLQRQAQLGSVATLPIWQRADDRFFWNKFLQTPLISLTQNDPLKNNFSRFILPVICGFVTIVKATVHATPVVFAIISRRNQHRVGTRYHSRGIDDRGNVSNFVETEQILEVSGTGYMSSVVQTRGSIPLFWRQVINVKYQPKLVIEDRQSTATAFRNHFYEQFKFYGNQIVVNLINKHGYESPLGVEFANRVGEMKDERIRFIHFDFHENCRKMRWDRISVLIQSIQEDLDEQGYCIVTATGTNIPALIKSQTSVVRTNCIDCLDRTNVVQSVLARRSLNKQLHDLKLMSSPLEDFSDIAEFEHMFKNAWADNADEDSFDLFLGNYRVDPAKISPFVGHKITPQFMLVAGLLILSSFCGLYMILIANDMWSLLLALLLAIACIATAIHYTTLFGTDFVALPQLVPDLWNPDPSMNSKYKESNTTDQGRFDIQMTEISQTTSLSSRTT